MPLRELAHGATATVRIAPLSPCAEPDPFSKENSLLGFDFAEENVPKDYEFLNDIASGCFGEVQDTFHFHTPFLLLIVLALAVLSAVGNSTRSGSEMRSGTSADVIHAGRLYGVWTCSDLQPL